VSLEHASFARLDTQVNAFICQHMHDARRWHRGEARLVGHGQQRCGLKACLGMGRIACGLPSPASTPSGPSRVFQR
jgi:hypothetical protein